eukprot:204613-Rhodomonas_salina.1
MDREDGRRGGGGGGGGERVALERRERGRVRELGAGRAQRLRARPGLRRHVAGRQVLGRPGVRRRQA